MASAVPSCKNNNIQDHWGLLPICFQHNTSSEIVKYCLVCLIPFRQTLHPSFNNWIKYTVAKCIELFTTYCLIVWDTCTLNAYSIFYINIYVNQGGTEQCRSFFINVAVNVAQFIIRKTYLSSKLETEQFTVSQDRIHTLRWSQKWVLIGIWSRIYQAYLLALLKLKV